MATSTDGPATAPRIPAWKRIGLKLKYAKETPEQNTPPAKPSPNEQSLQKESKKKSSKRPAYDEVEPETPAPKRVKASIPEQNIASRKYGFGASSQPSSDVPTKTPKRIVFDDADQPSQAGSERPSLSRKSVSFTPDTKAEDGFSASNYFKAWAQGEANENETQAEEEPTSPSKPETSKPKKAKKPKNSKSTLPSTTTTTTTTSNKESPTTSTPSSSTTEVPAYITYLTTFATSKSHWKFSKAHQNSLLKNLFNIYRIPPAHNAALTTYIAGLQGSARSRVAQEAREILPDDGTLEHKIAKYEEAKTDADADADETRLENLRREVERARRAEAILRDALDDQDTKEGFTASSTTVTEKPQPDTKPQRRKRKARTEVSSSSSSSSDSSSSESDSDSDSDSSDSD